MPQHPVSPPPPTGFLLSLWRVSVGCRYDWCSTHLSVTTPIGFASLGYRFYFIWGAVAFSIIPSVFFFYPETTGLSVEEIDQVFIESSSIFATVRLAEQRREEKRRTLIGAVENFDDPKKPETVHTETE